MDARNRIVVVGGGYGGVMSALRAARKLGRRGEVVLVSAEEDFVERIRLHEAVAAGRAVRRPIPSLLRGSSVRFVRGRVTAIHPRAGSREGSVALADGTSLGFDRLVLALGSSVERDRVPGVREHTRGLDPNAIDSLREEVLAAAARGGRVVICGGGLTGIEAATELAEAHPSLRVTLLTGGALGEQVSGRGRDYLRAALARLGVTLREGVRVERIERGVCVLGGGERAPFDVCLWAGGFTVPALVAGMGLATNSRGQALVDPFLRALGHDDVYVVGDAASPVLTPGAPVAMACKTAMPMGAHASRNVVAGLVGEPERPFDFGDSIICISLGRRDGLVQRFSLDGQPMDRIYTGRLGAWIKELVCRYTVLSLRAERHGFDYRWPRTGHAPRALPSTDPQALLPPPEAAA